MTRHTHPNDPYTEAPTVLCPACGAVLQEGEGEREVFANSSIDCSLCAGEHVRVIYADNLEPATEPNRIPQGIFWGILWTIVLVGIFSFAAMFWPW